MADDLIERLRAAADWVKHEADSAPAWDDLLLEAADEIERLRTKLAGHDQGLDRWCNYQDRLVETLDRLGLRETVLAELERDGWRNVPECAHKADAERLRGQLAADLRHASDRTNRA